MKKIEDVNEAMKLIEFLDKEYGLIIGDLERQELERVRDVIDQLLALDDRALKKVNIETLRKTVND